MISLHEVSKHVLLPDDSRLEILHSVTLEVFAQDHIAIVGRSGSGKSTLLNLMGLLDAPSTGEVRLDGRRGSSYRHGALDRLRGTSIGFVFQQFNLLNGRTALENVMMPLGYASGSAFWRRRRLATEMLERVGLGHRIDQMPERLSG
ncbi:MAG: ATP-binding cassette domain-containing protein, partial [Actinobacteria bacterium]|nr:ATP-binding cassette domain-containing protein [Actinomycetota bacterium]